MFTIKESDRLEKLKTLFEENRESCIAAIYKRFRQPFTHFAKRYTNDEEVIVDCFQEAVIGLYENLANDRIPNIESMIKTYLFTIGRNKLLNAVSRYKKLENIDDHSMINIIDEQSETNSEYDNRLKLAFSDLGESCRELLIKFYYQRYSIGAIMIDMDYKNENTVKAHKSRCLKKLRELFHTSNTGI